MDGYSFQYQSEYFFSKEQNTCAFWTIFDLPPLCDVLTVSTNMKNLRKRDIFAKESGLPCGVWMYRVGRCFGRVSGYLAAGGYLVAQVRQRGDHGGPQLAPHRPRRRCSRGRHLHPRGCSRARLHRRNNGPAVRACAATERGARTVCASCLLSHSYFVLSFRMAGMTGSDHQ